MEGSQETRKSRWIFLAVGILIVPVLLAVAYTWFALTWSYSKGERAGYVQKFSEKGWVCKTWEGELLMVAIPGTTPEKFYFSVRDDAVVKQLNQLAGRRVVLSYEQHKGIPTNCFGETEYFITAAKAME